MTAKKWRFWKLFLWGHLPLCKSGWCSIKPSDFSKDHHHCQGQLDEVYGKKGQIQIHRELYKFIYLNQVNYFCSFVLRIKNLFKKSIVIFLHLMDSYVLIIVAAYGTPIFKCAIKDNFGAKLNQIISFKSIIHSPINSYFEFIWNFLIGRPKSAVYEVLLFWTYTMPYFIRSLSSLLNASEFY